MKDADRCGCLTKAFEHACKMKQFRDRLDLIKKIKKIVDKFAVIYYNAGVSESKQKQ